VTSSVSADAVQCWDRERECLVPEKIPYVWFLHWLYGTTAGRRVADLLCSRRWFSSLGTALSHRRGSHGRIAPFIRTYGVPMDDYEVEAYHSFNDFFIRRFRGGARSFCAGPGQLPAWAEGACLGWDEVLGTETFPVKGEFLTPAALMGSTDHAALFAGGPLLLIRLRPQDYHRFHFVDEGELVDHYGVPGRLDSVNLLGLRHRPDILARNERQVTIQQSRRFGRLAYVEVGAMMVGRIVQQRDRAPACGEEKGYFEFGGSTVALFGEPGAWRPDDDLLERTAGRIETLIRLGSPIATARWS